MSENVVNHSTSRARPFNATTVGLWLVGIGLLVNAVIMLARPGSRFPDEISFDNKAFAQSGGGGAGPVGPAINTRGIYMMPAQLDVNSYGVYLLDLDSSTLVVYRTDAQANRLKLIASRTWKWDRFLDDFNNSAPTPKDVQRMVELARQREQIRAQDTQPANTQPVPEEKEEKTEEKLPAKLLE
jgi:hypothetical protein